MTELSQKLKDTYKEIRTYVDLQGHPPLTREIAERMGIAYGSAHSRIQTLIEHGYLKKTGGVRSLVIIKELN